MRLLDTLTGQFVEKDPRTTTYAILSHTWDQIEQTYQDVRIIQESYGGDGRLRSLTGRVHRMMRSSSHSRRNLQPQSPGSDEDDDTTPLEPATAPGPVKACQSSVDRHRLRRALAEPSAASIWYDSRLSRKVRDACAFARRHGHRYLWIDSCCIDKTSSSELSESINSMFQWYAGAAVCYTFLADVPSEESPDADGSRFRRSRWFTRGWTLQELVAPSELLFLSSDWEIIGSKRQLAGLIEAISNVDREALLREKPLNKFSVAQRLSWAARRETTRVEDRAYSLLGIFGINMSTLYGEGEGALRRLQEEIMRRIPDQSLFAWRSVYMPSQTPQEPQRFECNVYREEYDMSLLASSLDLFNQKEKIQTVSPNQVARLIGLSPEKLSAAEYTSSSYGIRMEIPVVPLCLFLPSESITFDGDKDSLYLAILGCEIAEQPGHLLGSFCSIMSSEFNVQFLYGGTVNVFHGTALTDLQVRLFPLSPATLERCRPHIQVKTVHVSHPGRTTGALETARDWRHTDLRLVFPTERQATLRAQGYTIDLQVPDWDRPRIHWLTLSNNEHVVTVEYEHILRQHGTSLTIRARVTMVSRARSDLDVQADPAVVQWADFKPWNVSLNERSTTLTAAGEQVLVVSLGLDFAGPSCYRLRVDVLH